MPRRVDAQGNLVFVSDQDVAAEVAAKSRMAFRRKGFVLAAITVAAAAVYASSLVPESASNRHPADHWNFFLKNPKAMRSLSSLVGTAEGSLKPSLSTVLTGTHGWGMDEARDPEHVGGTASDSGGKGGHEFERERLVSFVAAAVALPVPTPLPSPHPPPPLRTTTRACSEPAAAPWPSRSPCTTAGQQWRWHRRTRCSYPAPRSSVTSFWVQVQDREASIR